MAENKKHIGDYFVTQADDNPILAQLYAHFAIQDGDGEVADNRGNYLKNGKLHCDSSGHDYYLSKDERKFLDGLSTVHFDAAANREDHIVPMIGDLPSPLSQMCIIEDYGGLPKSH